jgi:hypothetical protein
VSAIRAIAKTSKTSEIGLFRPFSAELRKSPGFGPHRKSKQMLIYPETFPSQSKRFTNSPIRRSDQNRIKSKQMFQIARGHNFKPTVRSKRFRRSKSSDQANQIAAVKDQALIKYGCD